MKSIGRFLPSRTSSLVRGLLPILGSSRIVRKIGSDLLSRGDIATIFLSLEYAPDCSYKYKNIFFLSKF